METDIVMLNIEWFLLLFYRMGEREWEREKEGAQKSV